jgi:hypothetical protein
LRITHFSETTKDRNLIFGNIYGLGVGISTIKKFTSGKGWGITLGPEL